MNIGIDARVLGTSRALDRYTRNLIIQLSALKTKHTFIVFFSENLAFESLGVPKRNNLRYIAMPPTPVCCSTRIIKAFSSVMYLRLLLCTTLLPKSFLV